MSYYGSSYSKVTRSYIPLVIIGVGKGTVFGGGAQFNSSFACTHAQVGRRSSLTSCTLYLIMTLQLCRTQILDDVSFAIPTIHLFIICFTCRTSFGKKLTQATYLLILLFSPPWCRLTARRTREQIITVFMPSSFLHLYTSLLSPSDIHIVKGMQLLVWILLG